MNNEMNLLTYHNMVGNFIIEFPELNDRAKPLFHAWYQEDGDEEGDLLGHIFFGSVVIPFLVDEAFTNAEQTALQHRLFEFLERMATSEDPEVQDVLTGTILKQLNDHKAVLSKARDIMGTNTFLASVEIEFACGRD